MGGATRQRARRGRAGAAPPPGVDAYWLADDLVLFVVGAPRAESQLLDRLTPAERSAVQRLCEGLSNREIARARRVSPRTIANQIASAFRKLEVGSRAELVARLAGER